MLVPCCVLHFLVKNLNKLLPIHPLIGKCQYNKGTPGYSYDDPALVPWGAYVNNKFYH